MCQSPDFYSSAKGAIFIHSKVILVGSVGIYGWALAFIQQSRRLLKIVYNQNMGFSIVRVLKLMRILLHSV